MGYFFFLLFLEHFLKHFLEHKHIGLATSRDDYSNEIYKYLSTNNIGFDFIDTHLYTTTPSLIPWNIHKPTQQGSGGQSLETIIASYGFPINSRIQIGEWSR